MARKKTKMTAFARFLIFLLIAAPTIYLGASYYKGEDGIQNIKNLVGINSETATAPTEREAAKPDASTTAMVNSQVAQLKDEMEDYKKRAEKLYLENEKLKESLQLKETELKEVKDQLQKIKTAIGQ